MVSGDSRIEELVKKKMANNNEKKDGAALRAATNHDGQQQSKGSAALCLSLSQHARETENPLIEGADWSVVFNKHNPSQPDAINSQDNITWASRTTQERQELVGALSRAVGEGNQAEGSAEKIFPADLMALAGWSVGNMAADRNRHFKGMANSYMLRHPNKKPCIYMGVSSEKNKERYYTDEQAKRLEAYIANLKGWRKNGIDTIPDTMLESLTRGGEGSEALISDRRWTLLLVLQWDLHHRFQARGKKSKWDHNMWAADMAALVYSINKLMPPPTFPSPVADEQEGQERAEEAGSSSIPPPPPPPIISMQTAQEAAKAIADMKEMQQQMADMKEQHKVALMLQEQEMDAKLSVATKQAEETAALRATEQQKVNDAMETAQAKERQKEMEKQVRIQADEVKEMAKRVALRNALQLVRNSRGTAASSLTPHESELMIQLLEKEGGAAIEQQHQGSSSSSTKEARDSSSTKETKGRRRQKGKGEDAAGKRKREYPEEHPNAKKGRNIPQIRVENPPSKSGKHTKQAPDKCATKSKRTHSALLTTSEEVEVAGSSAESKHARIARLAKHRTQRFKFVLGDKSNWTTSRRDMYAEDKRGRLVSIELHSRDTRPTKPTDKMKQLRKYLDWLEVVIQTDLERQAEQAPVALIIAAEHDKAIKTWTILLANSEVVDLIWGVAAVTKEQAHVTVRDPIAPRGREVRERETRLGRSDAKRLERKARGQSRDGTAQGRRSSSDAAWHWPTNNTRPNSQPPPYSAAYGGRGARSEHADAHREDHSASNGKYGGVDTGSSDAAWHWPTSNTRPNSQPPPYSAAYGGRGARSEHADAHREDHSASNWKHDGAAAGSSNAQSKAQQNTYISMMGHNNSNYMSPPRVTRAGSSAGRSHHQGWEGDSRDGREGRQYTGKGARYLSPPPQHRHAQQPQQPRLWSPIFSPSAAMGGDTQGRRQQVVNAATRRNIQQYFARAYEAATAGAAGGEMWGGNDSSMSERREDAGHDGTYRRSRQQQ